jgi:hypothetical protein
VHAFSGAAATPLPELAAVLHARNMTRRPECILSPHCRQDPQRQGHHIHLPAKPARSRHGPAFHGRRPALLQRWSHGGDLEHAEKKWRKVGKPASSRGSTLTSSGRNLAVGTNQRRIDQRLPLLSRRLVHECESRYGSNLGPNGYYPCFGPNLFRAVRLP